MSETASSPLPRLASCSAFPSRGFVNRLDGPRRGHASPTPRSLCALRSRLGAGLARRPARRTVAQAHAEGDDVTGQGGAVGHRERGHCASPRQLSARDTKFRESGVGKKEEVRGVSPVPLSERTWPSLPAKTYKNCSRCGEWLPFADFPPDPRNKRYGLSSRCRRCQAESRKAWREANREYIAAYNEARRTPPTPLECSECGAAFLGRPDRKTCSPECRRRWKARNDRRWGGSS